jgi:tRNA1Val (adenine37-N6)-methyltransferase
MAKLKEVFHFKHFTLSLSKNVMKVSTDSILLGCWAQATGAKNILDIGTGSGILALLMAQKSHAHILAIDVSNEAVEIARKNFENSLWNNRLKVLNTSLQSFVSETSFDVIVSNPPYFNKHVVSPYEHRKTARQQEMLSFEELLSNTRRLLSENGSAYFCVPASRFLFFTEKSTEQNLYIGKQLYVTSRAERESYLVLVEMKRNRQTILSEELMIFGADGKYTPEFIKLTQSAYAKDFH